LQNQEKVESKPTFVWTSILMRKQAHSGKPSDKNERVPAQTHGMVLHSCNGTALLLSHHHIITKCSSMIHAAFECMPGIKFSGDQQVANKLLLTSS
jgi:hypothetical protein